MKFCYLGSELETHFCGIRLVLDSLKARGHEVLIKRWKFGHEDTERDVKNIQADIFLTEMTVPENEAPYTRPWIQFSHGISPYKSWNHAYSLGRWKARLAPTQAWQDYAKEHIKKNPIIAVTNGWAKADLYYRALIQRENIRKEMVAKYKFDPNRPIIIYAPTGMRHNAQSKIEWQQAGYAKNGYRSHGSYYHRELVQQVAKRHGNYYEIPHPCVSRGDNLLDRIKMMAIADLFIGDISSMSLEFTAIDKPIILLQKHIADQDPLDFRLFAVPKNPIVDLGDIITIGSLKDVLPYRLVHDDYKFIRNRWKELLLGEVDGKAAIREANTIETLAHDLL